MNQKRSKCAKFEPFPRLWYLSKWEEIKTDLLIHKWRWTCTWDTGQFGCWNTHWRFVMNKDPPATNEVYFRVPRTKRRKFELFKQLRPDMDGSQSPDPIILPKNKDFFSIKSIFICSLLWKAYFRISWHEKLTFEQSYENLFLYCLRIRFNKYKISSSKKLVDYGSVECKLIFTNL